MCFSHKYIFLSFLKSLTDEEEKFPFPLINVGIFATISSSEMDGAPVLPKYLRSLLDPTRRPSYPFIAYTATSVLDGGIEYFVIMKERFHKS